MDLSLNDLVTGIVAGAFPYVPLMLLVMALLILFPGLVLLLPEHMF